MSNTNDNERPLEVLGDADSETSIGFTYETSPNEYVEIDFENGKVGISASVGDDAAHMSWLSKEQAVEVAKQILGWAGEDT